MVVLTTNHLNKLVTLIEDNPLVKSFSDVETVLTHVYGKGSVALTFSETGSPKFQVLDLGSNTTEGDLLANTYKIEVDSKVFSIRVENPVYNGVSNFLVRFLYEDQSKTYVTVSL